MGDGVTRYWIEVQPRGEMLLGRKRGAGNTVESLDFIPGTAFRGALAALNRSGDWELFLEGVSFPDLTAGGSVPIPLSARECKYARGFAGPAGHGRYDFLLPGPAGKAECQVCGGDLKRSTGWMIAGASYSEEKCEKAATGHTGIDIRTRSAAAGLFYVEQTITSKTGFGGEVVAGNRHRPLLEELFRNAESSGIRLGHGLRKGLGQADFHLLNFQPDPLVSMAERLRGMQHALGKRSGTAQAAGLSVTLTSRAVLLDDYLCYRSDLTVEDLAASVPASAGGASALRQALQGFQPCRTFTDTSRVYGWNAVSGLPRSPDVAIAAGACFLFLRPEAPLEDGEIRKLAPLLETLETSGVGERRAEGFGRIVFCDPFHWRDDDGGYERRPGGSGRPYVRH
jgi:CRISPR-associated protein Csx10